MPFLLYPTAEYALENARRYRQVVVSQRYYLDKDLFAKTPMTYHHYRSQDQATLKIDGTAYRFGEIISERSVQLDNSTALITKPATA